MKASNTIYYFDLDNTIVDARKRYAYAGAEPNRSTNPKAYNAWLKRVQSEASLAEDAPLSEMVEKVKLLREGGAQVVFLTARETVFRDVTQKWLDKHGLHHIPLLMRPPENFQKSGSFKTSVLGMQMLKGPGGPVAMIDDDPDGLLEIGCKALGIRFYKVSFTKTGTVCCRLVQTPTEEKAA